jgi:hypothetical protein
MLADVSIWRFFFISKHVLVDRRSSIYCRVVGTFCLRSTTRDIGFQYVDVLALA